MMTVVVVTTVRTGPLCPPCSDWQRPAPVRVRRERGDSLGVRPLRVLLESSPRGRSVSCYFLGIVARGSCSVAVLRDVSGTRRVSRR